MLAAVVRDTCGWHDSFGGVANAAEVAEKYGAGRYQELRNGFHRNGTDNLLVELAKWGLGLEDLLMTLNLFSRVDVDTEGAFAFVPGNSRAGDLVELYAPMNTLVVLTAYSIRWTRIRSMRRARSISPSCAPRPTWRALPHLAPGKTSAPSRTPPATSSEAPP